jgi:hypothetical protein
MEEKIPCLSLYFVLKKKLRIKQSVIKLRISLNSLFLNLFTKI